jgi:hypothetical protein
MKDLKDSIYIKTIKLGFENQFGITLEQVIDNADISDKLNCKNSDNLEFKLAFIKWFYSNFYSESINSSDTFSGKTSKVNINRTIKEELNKVAIITGDAVNKYIDYLELQQTRISANDSRKTSISARKLAILSIIIASLSFLLQLTLEIVAIPIAQCKSAEHEYKIDTNKRYILHNHPSDTLLCEPIKNNSSANKSVDSVDSNKRVL